MELLSLKKRGFGWVLPSVYSYLVSGNKEAEPDSSQCCTVTGQEK